MTDREKISTGSNDRPLNDTLAGTDLGIRDKDEERRNRANLGAEEEVDTLPLEGE